MRKDLGVVSKTINLNKCTPSLRSFKVFIFEVTDCTNEFVSWKDSKQYLRPCFFPHFVAFEKSYSFDSDNLLRAKFLKDFDQQEQMTEEKLWNISTATKTSDAETKKGFFGRRG